MAKEAKLHVWNVDDQRHPESQLLAPIQSGKECQMHFLHVDVHLLKLVETMPVQKNIPRMTEKLFQGQPKRVALHGSWCSW